MRRQKGVLAKWGRVQASRNDHGTLVFGHRWPIATPELMRRRRPLPRQRGRRQPTRAKQLPATLFVEQPTFAHSHEQNVAGPAWVEAHPLTAIQTRNVPTSYASGGSRRRLRCVSRSRSGLVTVWRKLTRPLTGCARASRHDRCSAVNSWQGGPLLAPDAASLDCTKRQYRADNPRRT
jgi:hypothetical protein